MNDVLQLLFNPLSPYCVYCGSVDAGKPTPGAPAATRAHVAMTVVPPPPPARAIDDPLFGVFLLGGILLWAVTFPLWAIHARAREMREAALRDRFTPSTRPPGAPSQSETSMW